MPDVEDTVLVLGCGGFIGSHLAEHLLAESEHNVVGVDRVNAKIAHLLHSPRMEYIELDLADTNAVAALIEQADIVIHLAALCNPALYNTRPLEVMDVNFNKALPVVRACAERGKRLIHFSTCEVYGKSPAGLAPEGSGLRNDPEFFILSEDTSPLIFGPVGKQRWSYACAKQLLERVIYAEGATNGLEYTIVRPFNVVGPKMDFIPGVDGEGIPRVIPCFMRALLYREPLELVDGGRNRRTFIYIDDAIEGIMKIIERPGQSAGQIFNIGNPDNETTITDLASLMKQIFAQKTGAAVESDIVNTASRNFYGEGYDDCDRRVPDITKARELLGWYPTTPLDELLNRTVDWYLREYGDVRR